MNILKQKKKKKILQLIISILLVSMSCFSFDTTFIPHPVIETYSGSCSIHTLDFDNDNDKDILTGSYSGNISIWLNDGSQEFTQVIVDNNISEPSEVVAADFDNDGDMDIVASSYAQNNNSGYGKIYIYKNNGNNTFQRFTVVDSNFAQAGIIKIIDFDIDGDPDFVVASEGNDKVSWFENNGSFEGFVEHVLIENLDGVYYVDIVDIDDDNDLDLVTAAVYANKISLFRNNNDGTYTEEILISNFNYAHWIHCTDMDNDNDLDIVATAVSGDRISWIENKGTEGFESFDIVSGFNGAVSAFAFDYDNDGDVDIAGAAEFSGRISVFDNNNFSFDEVNIATGFSYAMAVHGEDLDNDGDTDIIASSLASNKLYWFENTLTTDIVSKNENEIKNFKLKQNYPNPFNPKTEIRYDFISTPLNDLKTAEIVVHDSLGKQIWSSPIADHGLRVIGSILFDGSSLNSGTYYYSLVIDGKKIDTKSMILIK